MTNHEANRQRLVTEMARVVDRMIGPLHGTDNDKLADNLAGWSPRAKRELAEAAKTARSAKVPSGETWADLVSLYRTRARFYPVPVVKGAL